jgi:Transposase DDE domain
MNINDLKNKIHEVMAYARVLVQQFGHTKKFAKHVVAFAIKQLKGIQTDIKLIEFVSTDPIGKEIGYNYEPESSIFSKVRERLDPEIIGEMITAITTIKYKNTIVDKIGQDSTDVDAYSRKDKDAKWGKRTIPKSRQINSKEKVENFFGYKLHLIGDLDREIPLSISVISGNRNDKITFPGLFSDTKRKFRLKLGAKFIADAQYYSSKIRRELRDRGLIPVIPVSGNQYHKTENPKDPDYGKRWSLEHIFSRLKEMFNMRKNRFIGLKKVKIFVYSCVLAYLIEYLL